MTIDDKDFAAEILELTKAQLITSFVQISFSFRFQERLFRMHDFLQPYLTNIELKLLLKMMCFPRTRKDSNPILHPPSFVELFR